jgi:hypothetical protein
MFTYKFKFGAKTEAKERSLLMTLLSKSRAGAGCKELCELLASAWAKCDGIRALNVARRSTSSLIKILLGDLLHKQLQELQHYNPTSYKLIFG